MTHNQLLVTIIIISSCFFIGSLMFHQGHYVIQSLLRGALGLALIGCVNMILKAFGIFVPVGINIMNFAVSAVLGIPGLLSLYGIGVWNMFH